MPALVVTHRVSMTLFVVLQLALLASAADTPPDAKKPAAEGQPAKKAVRGYLRVHAVPPTLSTGGEGKPDFAEFDFYKRNLAALIKSPLVIDRALDDKTIRDLPIIRQHETNASDWLADQIEVKFPGDAELMTIGMVTDDRQQARVIVDVVIAAFMKEVVDPERTDRLIRRDNLDKKLRSLKQQVLDRRRQLYELSQQIGTDDAQTAKVHQKIEIDSLQTLMRSRTETQKKVSDLTFKIKLAELAAKESDKNNPPIANTKALELERDLLIAQLKQTISQIETQAENVQKLEKFNGDADQLRAEIDQNQSVVLKMSNDLARRDIQLDAASRVVIITSAR
jgi:hypothetical protein